MIRPISNNPPAEQHSQGQHERADESIFQIVWRQKKLVVVCVASALILAIAFLAVTSREYTATAKLSVSRNTPVMTDRNAGNTSDAQDDAFLNTQREVILSTPVLALALDKPGYEDLATFKGVTSQVLWLKKNLDVQVGKKDAVIVIGLQGPDKGEAKSIVDGIVESYQATDSQVKREQAQKALSIFTDERDRADKELKTKNEQLIKLKAKQGTLTDQQIQGLTAAVSTSKLEAINARASYQAAAASITDPSQRKKIDEYSGIPLSEADEQQLKGTMFSKKQELEQLKRTYLPDHPKVQQAQGMVDALNLAYIGSIKLRWRAAEARSEELGKSYNELASEVNEQNERMSAIAAMDAEVSRLHSRLDGLDKNMEEAYRAQQAGALNIQVIEPAEVSEKPTYPSVPKILGVAIGAGILLGAGLGLGMEWANPKLRTANDVRSALGCNIIGVVPAMAGSPSPEAAGLAVQLEPSSTAAESYRSIRTSLQFGLSDSPAKTILITSPSPRDGKSTLASNLAITLAKTGKRVVLIDADLRRPSQSRIFGCDDEVGFSTMLSAAEIVQGAIKPTTVENLDIIPAGPIVSNPSELLNSEHLGAMLKDLSARYDTVLIDSPPLGAVDDARIVAATVDCTLLVLRATKTSRTLAQSAYDGLLSVGARVAGVVLNGAGTTEGGPLAGYYYEYGVGGQRGQTVDTLLLDEDLQRRNQLSQNRVG